MIKSLSSSLKCNDTPNMKLLHKYTEEPLRHMLHFLLPIFGLMNFCCTKFKLQLYSDWLWKKVIKWEVLRKILRNFIQFWKPKVQKRIPKKTKKANRYKMPQDTLKAQSIIKTGQAFFMCLPVYVFRNYSKKFVLDLLILLFLMSK